MNDVVKPLTDTAHLLLQELAKEQPDLFSCSGTLQEQLEKKLSSSAEEESKIFSEHTKWYPKESLKHLIADVVSGPAHDSEHVKLLRQIFPTFTALEMSDPRVLASLNCFHIADYVKIRWGSSNIATSTEKDKQTRFIKSHYLGRSKESNTIARLWWLYEFALRSSKYSKYDCDTLLEKMAHNVNFYHQILRRSYLMASDRVRAAVLDVAIASGLADANKTSEVTKVMRLLNRKAGGISLDVLSDEELRRHIKESLPPKEGAAPSPQP